MGRDEQPHEGDLPTTGLSMRRTWLGTERAVANQSAQALQERNNGQVEMSLAQRAGLACCTAERGKAEAMQALVGWFGRPR